MRALILVTVAASGCASTQAVAPTGTAPSVEIEALSMDSSATVVDVRLSNPTRDDVAGELTCGPPGLQETRIVWVGAGSVMTSTWRLPAGIVIHSGTRELDVACQYELRPIPRYPQP